MDRIRVLHVGDGVQSVADRLRSLEEFELRTARHTAAAKRCLESDRIDCVLGASGMTDGERRELVDFVRETGLQVPVVFLAVEPSGDDPVGEKPEPGVTVTRVTLSDSGESLAHHIRDQALAHSGAAESVEPGEFGEPRPGRDADAVPSNDDLIDTVLTALGGERTDRERQNGDTTDFEWVPLRGDASAFDWIDVEEAGGGGTSANGSDDPDSRSLEQLLESIDWADVSPSRELPAPAGAESGSAGRVDTAGERASDGSEARSGLPDGDHGVPENTERIEMRHDTQAVDPAVTDFSLERGGSHDPDGGGQGDLPGYTAGEGISRHDLERLSRDELIELLEPHLDEGTEVSGYRGGVSGPSEVQFETDPELSNDITQRAAPGESDSEDRRTTAVETPDTDRAGVDGPSVGSLMIPGTDTDRTGDGDGDGEPAEFEGEQGVGNQESGAIESSVDRVAGDENELAEAGEYHRPDDLELKAGTSILVQCGSQDDRSRAACADFLSTDRVSERCVLLIRYRQIDRERLETIASGAERTKIISIGFSQRVPESVSDVVETIKINNPNDVTRLGIVVSGTLDEWDSTGGDTVVCFDPLDVLLQYKNVQSTFRFLHIFLSKLQSGGVVSHFHVDPSAGDPQEINTLKPLFDAVVTIDSVGTHLEKH